METTVMTQRLPPTRSDRPDSGDVRHTTLQCHCAAPSPKLQPYPPLERGPPRLSILIPQSHLRQWFGKGTGLALRVGVCDTHGYPSISRTTTSWTTCPPMPEWRGAAPSLLSAR